MSEEKQCPQCKMVLAPDAPQGLCPVCLLKHALEPHWFASGAADQPDETNCASPTPAEWAANFPDLEILEVIGRGGMSMVYKARQKRLNRLVALKVIAPQIAQDPNYIARFRAEATAAARLNHPHIVQIYSEGESQGTHYLIEEFVEGESLRRRLDRRGRMDPQQALAVCVYMAEALDYAWREARLIHRDVKPDNILLSNKGAVKLSDLGLAKSVDGKAIELTRTGMTVGTPHYISPEQARAEKDIDFRSDIYSLGCTLYHMLTGQRPYHLAPDESPMAVVIRQVNEPPPPIRQVLPDCPMPVVSLLSKMLAKNPGDRHQSYHELIEELRDAHDAVVRGTGTKQQPATPASRKKWPVAIGGIAAVVAVAALLLCAPWKQREASKGGASSVPPVQKPKGEQKEKPKPPTANSPAPGTSAPPMSPDGFRALFNGRDLTGWVPMQTTGQKNDVHQPTTGGWTVQNGELVCSTTQSGWLKLEGLYGDFVLQLEFKLQTDGNSDVLIRCRDSGSPSRMGMQIQVIDPHFFSDNRTRMTPEKLTGAIYGVVGPLQPAQRPTGEWNSMEIRCEGDTVEVLLNGTRIVSANMSEYPELRDLPRSGCIGLSNWQGEAKGTAFRNIRIKELSDAGSSAVIPTAVAPLSDLQPGQPWTNSLGMKFLPVAGMSVRFSIWDTRVQDYQAFVTATGRSWEKPKFEQGPTHPAVMVSWDDAKAFCAWLTEKERRSGTLSSTQEYRLPTDMEWSTAVGLEKETGDTPMLRSGKVPDVYPWGTQWPPPRGVGNYYSPLNVDDFAYTSPVGSFAANRFSLYDMGGNVFQWCEDFYGEKSGSRVLRGSSWTAVEPSRLLSSYRGNTPPDRCSNVSGFRCVLAGAGGSAAR